MGTKNKPGHFDCYAAAEPDEPMFILLGRDPIASMLVDLWTQVRIETRGDDAKTQEAAFCAQAMLRWATERKPEEVKAARAALADHLEQLAAKVRG